MPSSQHQLYWRRSSHQPCRTLLCWRPQRNSYGKVLNVSKGDRSLFVLRTCQSTGGRWQKLTNRQMSLLLRRSVQSVWTIQLEWWNKRGGNGRGRRSGPRSSAGAESFSWCTPLYHSSWGILEDHFPQCSPPATIYPQPPVPRPRIPCPF